MSDVKVINSNKPFRAGLCFYRKHFLEDEFDYLLKRFSVPKTHTKRTSRIVLGLLTKTIKLFGKDGNHFLTYQFKGNNDTRILQSRY